MNQYRKGIVPRNLKYEERKLVGSGRDQDNIKVSYIKSSVVGDIQPSNGGIKTTKSFMKDTIIQENAKSVMGRNFVRHISRKQE